MRNLTVSIKAKTAADVSELLRQVGVQINLGCCNEANYSDEQGILAYSLTGTDEPKPVTKGYAIPWLYGEEVSDKFLSAALGHSDEKAWSELMEVAVPGKGNYVLRLCGVLQVRSALGHVFFGPDLPFRELNRLDRYPHSYIVMQTPWFQWLDEDGDCVGNPFGILDKDYNVEVARLMAMLQD